MRQQEKEQRRLRNTSSRKNHPCDEKNLNIDQDDSKVIFHNNNNNSFRYRKFIVNSFLG